ncbi:hypothetical protein J437_LFUL019151 [Ladona fulva]|uniref:DDE Tnp4 domain-containing protein n=1 Tax=Ladona fulva TaxID=123851 RepID=A0A8K0P9S3_LADFU|nr:hypothetical protein J437_LFUL019151 [Ladona fulva]
MSEDSFTYLVTAVTRNLQKKDTHMRDSIAVEERLSVTLRYLATGCSLRSLHFEYLIGRRTLSTIVEETCNAIWCALKDEFIKEPNEEEWIAISEKFSSKANFPQCLGAIDGKHVRIVKPAFSGSNFFNYKKYFSIVLMAIADADYCFTYVDVGAYGKDNDSNVLKNTNIGKQIYSGNLKVPEAKPLSHSLIDQPVPYVFVADEAFALSKNVMRPFPSKGQTTERRIFNYRLTRARRFVECAFGIMSNKWRILHRPLDVKIELASAVVKTCCILHNFVRERDGYEFEDTLTCNKQA